MITTQYSGRSDTAHFVQGQLTQHHRFLHKSSALGVEKIIREELADVWEECQVADWDGYGALPITWDTYCNAERLLLSLPLGGVPTPSIGAEPDGSITLEWHNSRRRTLSISVGPDNEIHYAALLGPGNSCGTELFFDEAPKRILELIGHVYSC